MKKVILYSIILTIPLTLSAMTCSDSEVFSIIEKSRAAKIERIKNNKLNFPEYRAQRAYIKVVADQRTSTEENDNCMANILPSLGAAAKETADQLLELMNAAKMTTVDMYGALKQQTMAEILAMMKEGACKLALDMSEVAVSETKQLARKEYERRMKGTALSGFVSDSNFDSWINRSIDDNFDSKYDLIEWRGGYSGEIKPEGNSAKNKTDKKLDNVIRGLIEGG